MLFFHATTPLGQAFAVVMNGLCRMIGHHAALLRDRGLLLGAIHWRLARMIGRLDRLTLRWQANTLPKPRAPRRRRATPENPPAPRPARLPSGRLWLIHALQPTAQFSGQLEVFLAQPDTRALVQAAPQAGRILRPLCRGLGVALPDWLRLPDRAPIAPRQPKARAPKPLPCPDRPLPAYVLAAVRAWKKYDR